MQHIWNKFLLVFLLLGMVMSSLAEFSGIDDQEDNQHCRGKYLRTEIVGQNDAREIVCQLITKDGYPGLLLSTRIRRTILGVKLYEALLRILEQGGSDGIGGLQVRYELIPGEVVRGEEEVTTTYISEGVCANRLFEINGVKVATNEDGVIVDRPGENSIGILEYFDDLDKSAMPVNIGGSGLVSTQVTLYRRMPQRPSYDDKRLEEPENMDILRVYGLNFMPISGDPERHNLQVSVEMRSTKISPSVPLEIVVKVKNNGILPTNCLVGRSFSRVPWLNGKWFYFGAIAPGKTGEFRRSVICDNADLVSRAYMQIGFRDSFGPLNNLTKTIELDIKK